MKLPSVTMQAVSAVRVDNANLLGEEEIMTNILEALPDARTYRNKLDQASNGMFSRSIIIRTLYFNDILKKAENECEQLVIMSSGLDFRFLKSKYWKEKPKFLLDHPVTMDFVQNSIKPYREYLSKTVQIPIDFEEYKTVNNLVEILTVSGFQKNLPTLFLWEGATFYISPEFVIHVLKNISPIPKCEIAVDFANYDSFLQRGMITEVDDGVKKTFKLLESRGEPWKGFFKPDDIKKHLLHLGFDRVKMLWDNNLEQIFLENSLMSHQSMFYINAKKDV